MKAPAFDYQRVGSVEAALAATPPAGVKPRLAYPRTSAVEGDQVVRLTGAPPLGSFRDRRAARIVLIPGAAATSIPVSPSG